MIALLLALQASAPASPAGAPAAVPVLGAIGPQALPAKGCAAFLWSAAGDRTLVAMAVADPAHIRLAIDGAPPADLALAGVEGSVSLGFAPTGTYKAGNVTATLALTITTRPDLTAGAMVSQGTLSVELQGRDTVVLPVAGLVGCAS